MWINILKSLLCVTLGWGFLFLPTSTLAFDKNELSTALLSRIDNGIGVGSVVGIIDGDREELIVVGTGSKATNKPLTEDSLLNIGSLSKTFTGLLLADMVLKKEIDLDLPVEECLSEHVSVPSFDGHKITIRHLVTHRSGLPGNPTNLRSNDSANLYANYSVSNLYEYLASYRLDRTPGEASEYSNTGFALLGHCLEIITGKPYESLLSQRVFLPLGMYHTTITVADDQLDGATSGHNQLQEVVDNGVLTAFAPAGGIKSSGGDMLRYLKANMGLIDTSLSAAIELSHEVLSPYSSNNSIGYGWFIREKGRPYVGHSGAVSGYRSSIGFDKAKKRGLFVITNSFDKAWDISWAIEANNIDSLIQKPIKTVPVSVEQLKRYAGTYVFDDKEELVITQKNGELFAQTPGQLKIRMLPISTSTFALTFVEGKVSFVVGRSDRVSHLVLYQGGTRKADRIK